MLKSIRSSPAGLRVAGLLVAALLLTACGAGPGSATPLPTEPAVPVDASGSWVLTSGSAGGRQIPIVAGTQITLTIEGQSVGGRSACNQYFGELTLIDGVVRIGGLGGTEMGCDEPVMASEAAYLGALAAVTGARMDGEALVLLGPDVELRFDRLEAPPTADIVGTDWVLEALVQGDAVASTIGEPATLVLHDDGTLEGSTGCRTLAGRYVVRADEIEFTEFAAEGECAGGPADQDSHIVDVLGDGFRAAVDGEQLTLTSDGARGLIYRVAPTE